MELEGWSHVTPLTQRSQTPSDRISGFQKCMLLPPTTIGGRNSQTPGSKSQSEATNLPLRRLDCISDALSIVQSMGILTCRLKLNHQNEAVVTF